MALVPSSWPPAGRSWWPPTGGSNRLRGPVPAGAGRARLGPLTLPCRLGTAASFNYTGFNGRALSDDVTDVMLSLRANSAPGDGVASDPARIHADSRIPISGRQPEGRIEQMTAAESFDAGIARQIGHYADAVRVPVGLPRTAHGRATWPGQATQAWQNIQTTLSQAARACPTSSASGSG
jgi:hypothetical protein